MKTRTRTSLGRVWRVICACFPATLVAPYKRPKARWQNLRRPPTRKILRAPAGGTIRGQLYVLQLRDIQESTEVM